MRMKHFISGMLVLVFFVCSVSCARASADEAKTLWETALDSLFAAMSGETDEPESGEEWEEGPGAEWEEAPETEWDAEWEAEWEEEWEEDPEEEPQAEPEDEPGVYMNLDGISTLPHRQGFS